MKDIMKSLFAKIRAFIPKREKFVYVALGDSTVEGIGATNRDKSFASLVFKAVKHNNGGARFYNLGKRGAKIADVIDTQLEEAIAHKPNLVTISVGANDLRARTSIGNFERDIAYLVNSLNEKTDAKIILNSIPDLTHAPAIPFLIRIYASYMAKKFNHILREQAEKANVIFVDIHYGGKIFGKKYPELVSADGLHPSDIGYAFWAAAIISQAKEVFFGAGDK